MNKGVEIMDINELIYEFKAMNGVGRVLKTSFSDQDLADVIVNISRKTFSHYFKHKLPIEGVRFAETDRAYSNTFYIPSYILDILYRDDMKVISISNIEESRLNLVTNGVQYAPMSTMGMISAGGEGHVLSASLMRRKLEFYNQPLRYNFISPDKINFKASIDTLKAFDIIFEVTHPKSLATISEGYYEAFKELAVLDLRIFLWNNEFKYLDETTYGDGTLSLKIDKFSTAEDDKKELIDKWKEDFVLADPILHNMNSR